MLGAFLVSALLWTLARFPAGRRSASWMVLLSSAVLLLCTRLEAFLWVGLLAPLTFFLWRRYTGVRAPGVVLALLAALDFVRKVLTVEGYGDWSSRIESPLAASVTQVFTPEFQMWLHPDWTPVLLPVLAGLGLALGLWKRRPLALYLFAALTVGAYATTTTFLGLMEARYMIVVLLLEILLAAAGVALLFRPLLLRSRRRLAAGLALLLVFLLAVSSVRPWNRAVPAGTLDREGTFLRNQIPRLPVGSEVHVLSCNRRGGGWEIGLFPPDWILLTPLTDRRPVRFHAVGARPDRVSLVPGKSYYLAPACCSLALRTGPLQPDDEQAQTERKILAMCRRWRRAADYTFAEVRLPNRPYTDVRYRPGEE